jgi:hypothetical protein
MPVLVLCAAGYGIALAWIGVRIAARAAGKRLPELCQIANLSRLSTDHARARRSTAGCREVPRGIGHVTARVLAEHGRGYRVAGTARKPGAQSTDGVDMLPLAAAATIYPGGGTDRGYSVLRSRGDRPYGSGRRASCGQAGAEGWPAAVL